MLLPRRKSWRLCYDRVEMVGVLRKELSSREKMRTEKPMSYFRDTRRWGDEAERWLGEEVPAGWRVATGKESNASACVGCQDDVLDVADRGCGGTEDGPHDNCRENSAVKVCTVWRTGEGQEERAPAV